MKRWISILLFLALILIMTGCDNSGSHTKTGNSQSVSVNDVLQQGMAEADNKTDNIGNRPTEIIEPGTVQNAENEDPGNMDIDLTVLSSTMVYAEVYNMMVSPDEYIGKTVRMKGRYACYQDEITENNYFACIIQDATACCAQGIEFVLTDDYIYPDDYPEIDEEICVYGVFDTYQEGEYTYCTLRNAKLVGYCPKEKSDTSRSIYDVLKEPRNRSFSNEVYDEIAGRWEEWDQKDSMTKALSSTMPGFFTRSFETWEEAVTFVGFRPWNPFESADWAEKMNYTGADIKNDGILEHCHFEGIGKSTGELESGTLRAGYACDGVRIQVMMNLAGEFNLPYENEADVESVILELPLSGENEKAADGSSNCRCRAIRRHTDRYDGLELAFIQNGNMVFDYVLTSFEGIEKLKPVYGKVSECLGFDIDYDGLFSKDSFLNVETDKTSSSEMILDFNPCGEMIPYDTERTGAAGGYLFIPIDGKIYRYETSSARNGRYTLSDRIFDFVEQGYGEEYYDTIYRLEEFPEGNVLCMHTAENNGISEESLITVKPASQVPDDILEKLKEGTLPIYNAGEDGQSGTAGSDAASAGNSGKTAGSDTGPEDNSISGFVIHENGSVTAGKELWNEFYKKTQAGEPASVRIAWYYTLDRERCDEGYYEAVKDDYPALYLNELYFNGAEYALTGMVKNGDAYVSFKPEESAYSWKYLLHLTGKPRSPSALFTGYDKYVLTNDDSVTWEDLERGMLSSRLGDYIPFAEVCCEYTWK